MYCIGMDIGGTSIRIALLNAGGQLSAYKKIAQETVLHGDSVEALACLITDYIKDLPAGTKIEGLAVGIPGTLDAAREVVLNAPNIHGLDGVNIKEALSARLPFPVFVEKDVSMLFTYDRRRFQLPDTGVVMACYVGTGLGNTICIDGKLLTGSHGAAGELGHIPYADCLNVCGCGNTGCAETLTGGKYLAKLKDELFPETAVSDLFALHGDHPEIQTYVARLASVIATEINILDPAVVVLGGGVPAMTNFPNTELERHIREHTRKPLPESKMKIIFANDDGTNGVTGAGLYAWEQVARAGGAACVRAEISNNAALLCPSLMCADFSVLGEELASLEQAGADMFHIDIMDGAFVPAFGMGLQDTRFVLQNARIPADVHLMIQNPGAYAEMFAKMGADLVYIHAEADVHAPRTLQKIIDAGAKPGIAINPGTAVETIAPLLSLAEYVLVMTVNPGFAGQEFLPFVEKKIDTLLAWRAQYGYRIVIDGACSPERINAWRDKGVDGFVLGTSALFGRGRSYAEILRSLREDTADTRF